jgi:hypothetical protein
MIGQVGRTSCALGNAARFSGIVALLVQPTGFWQRQFRQADGHNPSKAEKKNEGAPL